jgi:hypothetical protein
MDRAFAAVACFETDASAGERFIVRTFGFWPLFVFTFGGIVALFDNSVFLLVTTLLLLSGTYFYLEIVAAAIGVPRQAGFDPEFCQASPFALPDARFVTAMMYTVVVLCGVYYHRAFRSRVSLMRLVFLVVFIVGYLTSTIISRYFLYWQLAANSALAFLLAMLYWFAYCTVERVVWGDANASWRRHFEALAQVLGAHVRRNH